MRLQTSILSAALASTATSAILPFKRDTTARNPTPLLSAQYGALFHTEVIIGDQPFTVLVDTGSSDVWVPASDFQCVVDNLEVRQDECNFQATYDVPDDIEYVANQTFGVQYGTGIALGKVAKQDVTLGGITVTGQTVGIVDRTSEVYDGTYSGILGLGYKAVTSAHPGTSIDNDTLLFNRAPYDPLFVSMYKQGSIEPWYSLAIDRVPRGQETGAGGWLGLGELPPVPHSDKWAVAPVEVTEGLPEELTGGVEEITLMTLSVDGLSWASPSNKSVETSSESFQAVVDSGHNMNLIPTPQANAVNAAFDPPAIFDEDTELYMVDCDSKTPKFGVTIGGVTFWHEEQDMIYEVGDGTCYSSVGATGEDGGLALNFLGDAFLKNVVSVFDFGRDEMRFAARKSGCK